MCKKHPKTATGHRGMGLMQGIVVTVDREAFERKAFDKGLLVCMAGADVIRFVPPLTITEDEIHKAMDMHGIRICGYIRWSDRIYINVFCKSVAEVVWIFCSNLYINRRICTLFICGMQICPYGTRTDRVLFRNKRKSTDGEKLWCG